LAEQCKEEAYAAGCNAAAAARARYTADAARYAAGAAVDAALAAAALAAGFDAVAAALHAVAAAIDACKAIDAPIDASAMRRDLELLLETARAKGWTDATPVPPEFFGPLWPDGPPKGWPT
jgi:hypothetical protein